MLGVAVDYNIDRVPETLTEDILKLVRAPPKPEYPIATLDTMREHDAFLFGVPTRYGNMPVQWKVHFHLHLML